MHESEVGMLEEWIRILDKGFSLSDSVDKLADNQDYGPRVLELDDNLRLGQSFQEAMLESKNNFEDSTVVLARVGEYAGRFREEEAAVGKLTDILKESLKKARDLSKLNKQFSVDPKRMYEILACYSLGELTGCGVPILDAFKCVNDNFNRLGKPNHSYGIMNIHDAIRQGDTITNPMSNEDLFSKETVYLTAVGEETGDFDKTSKKAADILEAKITHNLSEDQLGEILFYYGIGMYFNAGLPCLRTIRLLEKNSKEYSIGPDYKILEKIGDCIESGDDFKEALSQQDYIPKEFINRLNDNGDDFDTEFLKYSNELFEKYCS